MPGIGDIGGLLNLCSSGSSGIVGDLNNICTPSLPQPEQATGGIDAMIEPPASAAGGKTLYDNYGIAGQFWAAHGLQCSDMTSLIGNNVAGMVFDAAKSVDRVTITVYQSAAGNNILTWLQNAVDRLISALGNAIYFPYLAPVVILGAIWLAWQGLVRKRATRTIEGTLWMVVACVAAIALIGKPADFTGVGTTVSNGVTGVLNTAFSKLPTPAGSNCLPVAAGDPQSVTGNFAFTSGNGLVDENANELWSVLVCKPWLCGELGTTAYATGNGTRTVVNTYGRQLLWSQAIAANETPSAALIQAKQDTYTGIATSIQQNDPAIYPLFQGNQWTTRLEIAFAAMFAALVAGLLILLIALTLIVLKLGFLLLLVAGPFFLIIGIHPGFGRVIAIRWFEMLVGVLMKQVAIAIVLSVLLYCYSLIMGTVGPGPALGAEDPDDRAGHGGRVHLPQALQPPVLRRRLRHDRLDRAGRVQPARGGFHLPPVDAGRRHRGRPRDGGLPGRPVGAQEPRSGGRDRGRLGGRRGRGHRGVGRRGGGRRGSGRDRRCLRLAAPAGRAASGRRRRRGELGLPPGRDRGQRRRLGAGQERDRGRQRRRAGRPAPRPAATAERQRVKRGSGSNGSAGSASGWSRGAGRSRGHGHGHGHGRGPGPRPPPPRPPPGRSGARRARVTEGPRRPSTAAVRGQGSGFNGSGPAWPASGWPAAGARPVRGRSGAGPRPTPPPAEPADSGGKPSSNGHGQDEPPATPFWLRPIRRDK